MKDYSALDKKYFIDSSVYNCPFCNRNNIPYHIEARSSFNWSAEKECTLFIVQCGFCKRKSLHLTFFNGIINDTGGYFSIEVPEGADIDDLIFFSQPTSFFVLDARIPSEIRELISEAEGCLKMNYLTGASACTRKSIYELLAKEKAVGDDYETKIKSLKSKYPELDPMLIDVLGHIQNMTSEKVHEQSWPKWDSKNLKLILETLKTILHEIYVLPEEKKERLQAVEKLRESISGDKKLEQPNKEPAS